MTNPNIVNIVPSIKPNFAVNQHISMFEWPSNIVIRSNHYYHYYKGFLFDKRVGCHNFEIFIKPAVEINKDIYGQA